MNGNIPKDENPARASAEGYRLALDQIKSLHAEGGRPLSPPEVAELVTVPFVWLGWPENKIQNTPLRGRPRNRPLTQYDSGASKWRRTLNHRLVRNPASARSGGVAMKAATLRTRDLIFEIATGFSVRVKKHERTKKVMAALTRFKKPKSLSTVQRALREFDKKVGNF